MSQDLLLPLICLIPVAPLFSAVVTALLGPKLLKYRSHIPCWSALAVSFVCSLGVLFLLPQTAPPAAPPIAATGTDDAPATRPAPAPMPGPLPGAPENAGTSQSLEQAIGRMAARAEQLQPKGPEYKAFAFEWLSVGGLDVHFELRVDSISAIMLAMVTGVSLLVALFGSGNLLTVTRA